MSTKFDAINKGDLKKFDGKKAKIVVNGGGMAADGEIWVNEGGDVVFLTDSNLARSILESATPKPPYSRAYIFYYDCDPDTFITNEYIRSVEIL